MKKRTKVIIVLCVLIVLVIAGVGACIWAKPYLSMYSVAKNLANEDYSYKIECYIQGITLKEGEYGNYSVYVEGEKDSDKLRSYIYSEEEEYLEVFANADGEVLFNLKPTCQYLSNKLEELLGVSYGDLEISIDDTYVSVKDIEEIIGMDLIGIDDFGVSLGKQKSDFSIKKINTPENINVEFKGENTYFFQLTIEDLGTKVVVGVPMSPDDSYLYIDLEKDEIKLEMYAEYDMNQKKEIDFPESSLDRAHIETFSDAYRIWLLGKKLSGEK